MNNNDQYLIREFGESIKSYGDKIIWFNSEKFYQSCIIKDFGFSTQLLSFFQDFVYGEYGLIDVRFFAKNKSREFQLEHISTENLRKLCELTTYLYDWQEEKPLSIKPELINLQTHNFKFDRYWDELDIYRQAEIINIDELFQWLEIELLAQTLDPKQRDKTQIFLNSTTIKSQFNSNLGNDITLYHLQNDGNENCAFAPFIFAGNEFIVVAAKRWDL